mgnify:CR=1 FL=1|jgi:two-component system chemotaxis response regulator CheY
MTTKYTIVSIDDSKAVHAFLDRCLSEGPGQDFCFLHAMGVQEGLVMIADNKNRVAAVLLDWEMPDITGYDGLPMILNKWPDLKVIILTSKNNPDDIMKMLERGAKEYMMKPFTPDILFDKLNTVIAG